MIGFYIVAILVIRVRRINLAIAALVLSGLLVLALILQATVADKIASYAALGLTVAVVMLGIANHFGAWASGDERGDLK